ncbi:MAG: DUF305 domain-containing protein [Sulfuriferula sp.]
MSQQRRKDKLNTRFDWKRVCMTVTALAALVIPPWANAQSGPVPANGATSALEPAAGTVEEKSAMEMKKAIDNLKEKTAAFQVTGNADYDFAMMARLQHRTELDLAKAELEHGKEPLLRNIATRIIESQKSETTQLNQWIELFHKYD